MAMPHAAMYKYDGVKPGKNEIGTSRQVITLNSEAMTTRMQSPPQQQFGFRVAAPNAAHIEPALLRCQNIRHIKSS
jgi:hypothetical protein